VSDARTWQGVSSRWLGQVLSNVNGAIPLVRAIVVGHDAADEGGMKAVSVSVTVLAGSFPALVMTSDLGFALWGLIVEVASAGALRLQKVQTEPAGATVAVSSLSTLRDVRGVGKVLGAAGGGWDWLANAFVGVHEIALGRPVVVGPREVLVISHDPANPTTTSFHALFEEGR